MGEVGIVGTASWGTTLGILLARQGVQVFLWARTEMEAVHLERDRENLRFLPGFPFPPGLRVTADKEHAFQNSDMVIFAVPSRSLRDNVKTVKEFFRDSSIIMSATKGLEGVSGKRMSQVLEEEIPSRLVSNICVLSGPNLSREIAQGKPSSTVVASRRKEIAKDAQSLLMSPKFRVYTNDDVIGVELAGALKNIIALGAGICDGLGYGDNAKAAFITRGLVEITRLGVAAGANPLTFAGLAGLGDLVATCSSPLSRNRNVGNQLAQGRSLDEIRSSMKNVVEGIDTTIATMKMAQELGVEMPITETTHKVLFKGLDPKQAAAELMGRAPRTEWAGIRARR
ncbi:MAG: NAD(P)-dependent glycerol-3-phosphate dehydrogenase [Chloroflexi bacterium]|nr:NAD(P)-dependent glycerol-3-phosphate dehydrogenase [Chloroflexota bacterium]